MPKFLRLLTEEDRVPCTGSHPYSALRKIEESCTGSFSGSLRGKTGLLTPEASHYDMRTGYHIHTPSGYFWCGLFVWNGALLDYPPLWILNTWHIIAFFQVYRVSKSSSAKNQNLHLSHTFDWEYTVDLAHNLSSHWFDHFCYEGCTLGVTWLPVLLWEVHINANLIIIITIRYFSFHCGRLRIPFCSAEFPNMCIPCWLFGSNVGWRASLMREKYVTPKARRKKQKKQQKQKNTCIQTI